MRPCHASLAFQWAGALDVRIWELGSSSSAGPCAEEARLCHEGQDYRMKLRTLP